MEALKKRSEFTFPTHIDFLPGPSPKLAYTANNAPVHGYEHALTGLLTKLDGLESCGDAEVRKARKEAVKRVEEELKRLDKIKADTQAEVSATEEMQSEVTRLNVDPILVPLPEDIDLEDDITETTDSEGTRPIDERPTLELLDPTSIIQADSASSPGIERLFNTVEYVAHSIPTTTSHTSNHEHTVLPESLQDIIGNTSRPQIPGGGSFRTSLVSSPSEVNEGGSDLELEGYVDATPLSGDGDTVTEEVENDGELEPMNKWDLDN
ncbi:BAG domain, partial [Rhizoctonia solani]